MRLSQSAMRFQLALFWSTTSSQPIASLFPNLAEHHADQATVVGMPRAYGWSSGMLVTGGGMGRDWRYA
jgi:hypothetical protein